MRERVRVRVGLRWRMFGWCCMCIFGVGGEDGDHNYDDKYSGKIAPARTYHSLTHAPSPSHTGSHLVTAT